jgi:hypothetical protein
MAEASGTGTRLARFTDEGRPIMHVHTLTRHRDIQHWVSRHRGQPAIRRVLNRFGQAEARLELTFSAPKARPENGMPRMDDGMSPVSWKAWLAELDRRQLALRVSDRQQPDFEFIERKELN